MKRPDSKYDKYWYAGLTAFFVIAAGLVINMLFNNLSSIGSILSAINSALTPVYIGLVIAYLLSPLVNKMDRYVFIPLMKKAVKKEDKAKGIARGLSVVVVLLAALFVIFGLITLVVPELVESLSSLLSSLPGYYRNMQEWGNNAFKSHPGIAEYFQGFSGTIYTNLSSWLQNNLLPSIAVLTDSIVEATSALVNVFIGLIISIYFMAGKENFCAQIKKLMYAVFPQKRTDGMISVFRETHTVFAKFISGKIIDSLAVGILTFIIMSIAGIPYAVLVSVIIGVTNMIPFFGQYIGIIPSTFLVVIADPWKGLIFLVLIVILMQFDGNVMGPKIMGDSIGLKSFWILFSTLFFGSLFGILGMLCAVPVFAMIYRMVKRWSTRRLATKNIPTETEYYRVEVGDKIEEETEEAEK